MKTQNIVHWFSLILLIVTVSGCVESGEGLTPPSLAISISPTSSVAPAPSFTPLPTASLTSTPTPTIISTLPVEKARTRLLDLLANNGSCRLPCLWDIAPGESSFQEAREILAPLSGLSYSVYLDPPGPGSIAPRYTEGDLEIYTDISFLTNPDNDTVNYFAFRAEAHRPFKEGGYEDVYDSKFFGEKVRAYVLPHVLSEQGIPTSVMISTSGGPLTRGGTGGFDILLLYPDKGILVNYTTQMHLIGANVRGCPPNAHVEMELYAPGNPESFFAFLEKTDWAVKKNGYKPLEDVTSMSLEEFYQTFSEPTDKCIETPTSLWPTPEP